MFGLGGGTLQFTFTAFSNSSAQLGSGAKNAFGNNFSSAFVDPLVYVAGDLKNFVDIEASILKETKVFQEFG